MSSTMLHGPIARAGATAGGSRSIGKANSLTQRSLVPTTFAANKRAHKKASSVRLTVRAADLNGFPIDTSGPTADFEFGKITEVTKDNFFATTHKNKDKVAVLDCYTSWCGPCKLIYPQLEAMAAKYGEDVLFLKMNCNPANKELGKALQVKVVPTFFIFQGTEMLDTITGAKPDLVEEAIKKQLERDVQFAVPVEDAEENVETTDVKAV
eukprot:CAMPEP_0118956466 /NCGR_PEP_ID=MMETSP1169-20130426/61593_1 /TAXON_ID=36882 /ORGANISM="Pyramimonas obovata, Strain CCMP722" /LENGTH=209 /DNA_ID=CAMNT_0006904499 /DNA_START=416 /DNA_END=1045 /DNA_ORIENTATION=-